MLSTEVFLSHSDKDKRFVSDIVQVMRQRGISVWYSKTHIRGAQQWHDAIGEALERCDWFAVVLSPNAVKSIWVKRELLFALQQDRYNDRIIPILYQPCKYEQLSWTLSIYQFVDFTGSFEKGCSNLLKIWGLRYQA
jgi:hypothetical protein